MTGGAVVAPEQQGGDAKADQQQQRDGGCQGFRQGQVEDRDHDQDAQEHHRRRQHQRRMQAVEARLRDARLAREQHGDGGRGIEAAQRGRIEQAAARRDVALQQVAGIGERADNDDGQPDLVGGDGGQGGDRFVGDQRQHDADDDQELGQRE